MKKVLLGLTALLGVGVIGAADLHAQEDRNIEAGGALNITVSGFARFLAAYGDLTEAFGKQATPNGNGSRGQYDFRNDTEVIFQFDGTDESTGIDYGGAIEFEADTDSTFNTDETWIYLSGDFGEFRFGDQDGASDNFKLGAFTIAAGTGGIDGTIVDVTNIVAGYNTGDSTKVIYYSPVFAGFQAGISYTPSSSSNGQNIRNTQSGGIDDAIEGGIVYNGEFGGFNLQTSVIGTVNGSQNTSGDDAEKIYAGLVTEIFGFSLAGGWGHQDLPDGTDTPGDGEWFNAGVAAAFGPANVSVTGEWAYNNDQGGEPHNIVVGADVGLMPGVSLSAEVAFFDRDDDAAQGGDDGYVAVSRLGMAF